MRDDFDAIFNKHEFLWAPNKFNYLCTPAPPEKPGYSASSTKNPVRQKLGTDVFFDQEFKVFPLLDSLVRISINN